MGRIHSLMQLIIRSLRAVPSSFCLSISLYLLLYLRRYNFVNSIVYFLGSGHISFKYTAGSGVHPIGSESKSI